MIFLPDGKVVEPGSYDWGWVDAFCDMMVLASPELQEEIFKQVNNSVDVDK